MQGIEWHPIHRPAQEKELPDSPQCPSVVSDVVREQRVEVQDHRKVRLGFHVRRMTQHGRLDRVFPVHARPGRRRVRQCQCVNGGVDSRTDHRKGILGERLDGVHVRQRHDPRVAA